MRNVVRALVLLLVAPLLAGAETDQSLTVLPMRSMEQPLAALPLIPRAITLELPGATIPVNLQGRGPLQLGAWFARADNPSIEMGGVILNLCVWWEIHPKNGYPNASVYQFRPAKLATDLQWRDYILQLDIPSMVWGGTGSVHIVPKAYFGNLPPNSEKYAIQPSATVAVGPEGMKGDIPAPDTATIRFPMVVLEYHKSTGKVQLRAGNLILAEDRGGYWYKDQPGKFQMGPFRVDVNAKTVDYGAAGKWYPVKLKVIVEPDIPGQAILHPRTLVRTKYWQ
ncbi:MAG: hypothetical protein F9K13_03940 [Candidatus Methylomirabilis oxygeniifera]|uniref:Uncharacterized protein n=1 Tax=Methylomirabilis oxygeniifera TaxID=671143 RepID=D5MLI0_METO1|nr:MAG: hypothetical protein F9K13_03940 [Candidatus Methylomirabilis oxyfera]CBE67846.1 exported protein of unknown function [Candidatus Methylomirabilis oxyfera]